MTKLDLSKDPFAEVMKKIDVSGRPTRGNAKAKVVAVNYDDFECPFCSRMHQTLFPDLLKEYGDRVLFIYKDFPLAEIHPWATHAAVNANCLAAQNQDAYWDFADYIHANQKEVNSEKSHDAQFAALDRIATAQGQKHNLDATKAPGLHQSAAGRHGEGFRSRGRRRWAWKRLRRMFVNGEKVDGALPIGELRAVLDRALVQAGETPPVHPAPAAGQHVTAGEQIIPECLGIMPGSRPGPVSDRHCGGLDLKTNTIVLRHQLVALLRRLVS